MHDFGPTASPYNGHMLRNLSKYHLFICCNHGSSTHFCHFLATAFVTDVLAGSNPSALGPEKGKASIAGGLTIQWWAMRDVRVRLAPPASASSPRSSRAALENASRFLSSAPLRVRIPLHWAQKGKAPIAGSLFNQVVGDEGCPRAAGAARFRFVAPLLACCAGKRLRVSSAPHPGGFESLRLPTRKRPGPLWAQGAQF